MFLCLGPFSIGESDDDPNEQSGFQDISLSDNQQQDFVNQRLLSSAWSENKHEKNLQYCY